MNQLAQLFTNRYPLFILLLGVIVALLAASEKISVNGNGIEITEDSIKFLWLIALSLIIFAVFLIIKMNSSGNPYSDALDKESTVNISNNYKAFIEQGERLDQLRGKLDSIRKKVEGANDSASKALSKALADIDEDLSSYRDRKRHIKSIIGWIEHHQDAWISDLKREDYKHYFKNKRSGFRQFKGEISSLINIVLKESVISGAFISPSKVGVNPGKLENPDSYKKALLQIRHLMEMDLDRTDIELFGSEERYILRLYIEGLISKF